MNHSKIVFIVFICLASLLPGKAFVDDFTEWQQKFNNMIGTDSVWDERWMIENRIEQQKAKLKELGRAPQADDPVLQLLQRKLDYIDDELQLDEYGWQVGL